MTHPTRFALVSTTIMLLATAGAGAEQTLQKPIPLERVNVERAQFEVIVWPPKNDLALCSSLTKADFDLKLSGRSFLDFDVDPLELAAEPPASPSASDSNAPRLVALLFNWWGMSNKGLDQYRPWRRAFAQARDYIETHPQDRYLITAIADEATFRSAVFQPAPEALATLDRYEAEVLDTGFMIKSPHLDTRSWREAVLEVVSRLGAIDPAKTKDLFVLTTNVYYTDILFPDKLRKRTTDNKVRVHSLDLAWDLRVLPVGLFEFSEAGGGVVFGDGNTLTTAIETLDRLRPCTYLMTMKVPDRKSPFRLSVETHDARFRVTAPEAVGGRFDFTAMEDAQLTNDLEDPTAAIGLQVTPELVPVSTGAKSAEYVLTLRVEKTGDFDPEEVGTLRVYGAVWNKLKPRKSMYADYSAFRIPADALRKIADGGAETLRFPEPVNIPNREQSVSVIVSVHGDREALSRVSASSRIEVELPQAVATPAALSH